MGLQRRSYVQDQQCREGDWSGCKLSREDISASLQQWEQKPRQRQKCGHIKTSHEQTQKQDVWEQGTVREETRCGCPLQPRAHRANCRHVGMDAFWLGPAMVTVSSLPWFEFIPHLPHPCSSALEGLVFLSPDSSQWCFTHPLTLWSWPLSWFSA